MPILLQCLPGVENVYLYSGTGGPGVAPPKGIMEELDKIPIEELKVSYPQHEDEWYQRLQGAVKAVRAELQSRLCDADVGVTAPNGECLKRRTVPDLECGRVRRSWNNQLFLSRWGSKHVADKALLRTNIGSLVVFRGIQTRCCRDSGSLPLRRVCQ